MDKKLLKIREAKSDDAREWFVLLNRVWRDAYNHIFPEEVFIEREKQLERNISIFDEILGNDEIVAYVAEYDGNIVGLLSGSLNASYDFFNPDYADLIALYIDPKYQGLGIGTLLRNNFEHWVFENGVNQYVIGVLKDNDKARKVYESWGGKLSNHEQDFIKLGIGYLEVFYTYNINK